MQKLIFQTNKHVTLPFVLFSGQSCIGKVAFCFSEGKGLNAECGIFNAMFFFNPTAATVKSKRFVGNLPAFS